MPPTPAAPAAFCLSVRLCAAAALAACWLVGSLFVPHRVASAAPGSDRFADAPVVGAPNLLLVDTSGASTELHEPVPPCAPSGVAPIRKTTWYRVVPSGDTLTVTAAGGSGGFRSLLALYSGDGSSIAGLTPVACGATWSLSAAVTAGQTYYLQIGGAGLAGYSDSGKLTIVLGPADPLPGGPGGPGGPGDTISPTVQLSSDVPEPATVSPIPVTVTFSESVTGFAPADIVAGNASVTNFFGSGAVYAFDLIPTGTVPVTVTAEIPANVAQDAAGNPNLAALAPFVRTYQPAALTVVVTSSVIADPTNVSPIPVTATFSESVVDFAAADLVVGNGAVSGFQGSGASYGFHVIPAGTGLVSVDIPAGVAHSAAGVANTAAARFSRFFDGIPPTTTAAGTAGSGGSAALYLSDTWTNQNVSVALNAVDDPGGSGVRDITHSASGAQSLASTTIAGSSTGGSPIAIALEGITVVSFAASDNAGNVETTKTFTVKLDKTPPTSTISPDPASPSGGNGWHTSDVTLRVTAADGAGASGVAQIRCALDPATVPASFDDLPDPATVPCAFAGSSGGVLSSDGQHVLYAASMDAAGNKEAPKSLAIKLDKTRPVVVCAAADGAWHAANVSLACTASDATSGLASAADASFSLATSVPAGVETANASTDSRTVCDVAGNCATAGPIAGNKVDRKAPTIAIAAPASATYLLRQAVVADYACADGGSGVSSCAGPVADGGSLDTASVGAKTFTVNAKDAVGNDASQSVSYLVTYNVCLQFDPTKVHNSGSTIPIRLQLCDAQGANVSSPSVVLKAESIALKPNGPAATPEDPGNSNPGNTFRYGGGGYQYNLKTSKGMAAGTYVFRFEVSGDPVPHTVELRVR